MDGGWVVGSTRSVRGVEILPPWIILLIYFRDCVETSQGKRPYNGKGPSTRVVGPGWELMRKTGGWSRYRTRDGRPGARGR